jgi:tRNA threonylcarbamoyladenosine biosynthesis protein TsaB
VRVLAVDTTTSRGSLAVVGAEGVMAEVRVTAPDGHSRWLLSAVDVVLRGLGIRPLDLDGFAVTSGPGSFTGLRVGLSSVQGLALACGARCLGLSSLDVLALAVAGSAPRVVALVDAFRGEVYAGVYDRLGGLDGACRVGRLEPVLEGLPPGTAFVGDGAGRHRDVIRAAVPGAVFPEIDLFLAVGLGRVAIERLSRGEGGSPADLRPLYLREADIRLPKP